MTKNTSKKKAAAAQPPKRIYKSGLAVAFIREAAVYGRGHAAWGFRLADGYYNFGGTENPEGAGGLWGSWHQGTRDQGGNNAAWIDYGSEKDMLKKMKNPKPYAPYDYAKFVSVEGPNFAAAFRAAQENMNCGFTGWGNNCLDATYRVLTAYGAKDLPWPLTNMVPNGWFNAIQVYKSFLKL